MAFTTWSADAKPLTPIPQGGKVRCLIAVRFYLRVSHDPISVNLTYAFN